MRRSHSSPPARLAVAALTTLAVAGATVACEDDDSADRPAGPSPTASASSPTPSGGLTPAPPSSQTGSPLELRVVRSVDQRGCPAPPRRVRPSKPTFACGSDEDERTRYRLAPASVTGGVVDATFGIPQQGVGYVVQVRFDGASSADLTELSRRLAGTGRQFAIVLDGRVLSAPTVESVITGGVAQIAGDFTASQARLLAGRIGAGG